MYGFLRSKALALYIAIGIGGTCIWAGFLLQLMVQTQPQFDALNLAFDVAIKQGDIEGAFNALSQNTTLFKSYMDEAFRLIAYWGLFVLAYVPIGMIAIHRYKRR